MEGIGVKDVWGERWWWWVIGNLCGLVEEVQEVVSIKRGTEVVLFPLPSVHLPLLCLCNFRLAACTNPNP